MRRMRLTRRACDEYASSSTRRASIAPMRIAPACRTFDAVEVQLAQGKLRNLLGDRGQEQCSLHNRRARRQVRGGAVLQRAKVGSKAGVAWRSRATRVHRSAGLSRARPRWGRPRTEGIQRNAGDGRVDLERGALLHALVDDLVAEDACRRGKHLAVLPQEAIGEHGQQRAAVVLPHLVRVEA